MAPLKMLALLALPLTLLSACSSDATPDGSGGSGASGSGGSGTGGGNGNPTCSMPKEVPCSDEVILGLNLQADITPGLITNDPDGAGWLSHIDATAGGAFASDPDSYTYGRFTDAGLEKVDISDEASLDSMDWDIAFRRYVIRINSGNSGPSCVMAAPLPGSPTYDSVTAAPENPALRADLYFGDTCEIISDTSGLPDSPATALSGYWSYPGCVDMTGAVYVLTLADGRALKLTVLSYYEPTVQEQCLETGTVPMTNSGAANFQVRWAFLP